MLNNSELSTLKIRELRGHVKHNIAESIPLTILNAMLENSAQFTEALFKSILDGLTNNNLQNIAIKGYENMRKFKSII